MWLGKLRMEGWSSLDQCLHSGWGVSAGNGESARDEVGKQKRPWGQRTEENTKKLDVKQRLGESCTREERGFCTSDVNIMHNSWSGPFSDANGWHIVTLEFWVKALISTERLFCAGHLACVTLFNLYNKPMRLVFFSWVLQVMILRLRLLNSSSRIRILNWEVVELRFWPWSFWLQNPDTVTYIPELWMIDWWKNEWTHAYFDWLVW